MTDPSLYLSCVSLVSCGPMLMPCAYAKDGLQN
jgi:hypothetical protein